MDLSILNFCASSFPIKGVSGKLLLLPRFIAIPVFIANSEDPDQTLHSAASDLGLNCLPISLLWDARHKWDKIRYNLCLQSDFGLKLLINTL